MRYPHLFEPIQLNQLKIRNRIVSTAHAEVYADNGMPGAVASSMTRSIAARASTY